MQFAVCSTAADAALRAANLIADELQAAVDERGLGIVALSGGHTPAVMMQNLSLAKLAWPQIHIFQTDERIVGENDERRNLNAIEAAFGQSPVPFGNVHPMPVEDDPLDGAAVRYIDELCAAAGNPPRLDVVHLGLGEDGHTASLIIGDAAFASDSDVAITGLYKGVRRMTLTLRLLNRARLRIWLATGRSKRDVVRRFLNADLSLAASHVDRHAAILVVDEDAAGGQR